MVITDKDREFIDFAWSCINRARYADSKQIVDTYNRVFADRINFSKKPYTSCGSCLRTYCAEMKRELDALLKKIENEEKPKEKGPVVNLEITELTPESIKDVKEPPMINVVESTGEPPKKKAGKKNSK